MLLLKPKNQVKRIVHAEAGAWFDVRPLSPAKREQVRARHRRANEVQLVPFMEEMAVFVISDWGGVGDGSQELPCLDEHKAEFGRSHAFNLMPWLLSEAEDLDQYIADEKASAKNG